MDPKTSTTEIPYQSPIEPIELNLGSRIQFDCHKGIACFNACCKNIDITLLPCGILRLKRRLKLDSRDFVARYTLPYEMDAHLDEQTRSQIGADEDVLYDCALRFLRQVLFGEQTIPLKAGAREQRIAGRKDTWEQRRGQVVTAQRESLARQQYESAETPPADKTG